MFQEYLFFKEKKSKETTRNGNSLEVPGEGKLITNAKLM